MFQLLVLLPANKETEKEWDVLGSAQMGNVCWALGTRLRASLSTNLLAIRSAIVLCKILQFLESENFSAHVQYLG